MFKINRFLVNLFFVFIAFGNAILSNNAMAQSIPNDVLSRPNTPIVTVGGFVNFSAAGNSQDEAFSDQRLPDATLNSNGTVLSSAAGTSNQYSREYAFTNDSEVHIKVGGISNSGIKYGAVIELEADVSSDARNEGLNADKSFVFTEVPIIGKFEFGNNSAVNQKMKVGPANFARAAGGINGKYLEYINMPMLAHSTQVINISNPGTAICTGGVGDAACDNFVKLPRFILIPQSPVAHGGYAKGFYNRATDNDYKSDANSPDYGSFNRNKGLEIRDGSFGDLEDATKISYYTPRNSGWQLGVSFSPDTGTSGTSASISNDDSGDIENVVSGGINYSDNFGNLGVALSVTGEIGSFEQSDMNTANSSSRNDLASYDVGLMFTYFGFTIGGSYGSWGDSLQPTSGIYSCQYDSSLPLTSQTCTNKTSTTYKEYDDATYYTGGAAYQFGPVAASITYLSSDFQNNKYQAGSLGIDYKMAKGLMPYIEVTGFKFESDQPKGTDPTLATQNQLKDNKGVVVLTGILFAF